MARLPPPSAAAPAHPAATGSSEAGRTSAEAGPGSASAHPGRRAPKGIVASGTAGARNAPVTYTVASKVAPVRCAEITCAGAISCSAAAISGPGAAVHRAGLRPVSLLPSDILARARLAVRD